MIDFTVSGKPQPAGSKQAFVNKHTGRAMVVDANRKSKPWQAEVKAAAWEAMEIGPGEWDVALEGPLVVEFIFGIPRPKTVKRAHPTVAPDTTKLIRGVEDACTGIVWRDDAQIVRQIASKQYTDGPGFARVIVTRLEEGA